MNWPNFAQSRGVAIIPDPQARPPDRSNSSSALAIPSGRYSSRYAMSAPIRVRSCSTEHSSAVVPVLYVRVVPGRDVSGLSATNAAWSGSWYSSYATSPVSP